VLKGYERRRRFLFSGRDPEGRKKLGVERETNPTYRLVC